MITTRKIIVFGLGDFADIVSVILAKLDYEIIAYTVHKQFITDQLFYNGISIIPFEEIEKHTEVRSMVLGFIGKNMFEERKSIFNEIKLKGFHLINVIDPSAIVDTECIGEGNIILQNTVIESHCIVGDCNIIWQNVVFPHHNRIGSFNNFAPSVSLSGYSKVEDNCFLGNNCVIKNKVNIQHHAFLGAGSYATKDIEAYSVLVPERSKLLEKKSTDFF